ncbi:AfsR/SARP family transcriptional regulator [Rhizocola hellebori]|uniref:AfsR/SARP family transcriptional regulator n=1 Tax=Rhizocola hellebori TaxID=1392758 RepID=UPI0019404606|nr:BTAD domain-containing putative transcriptional regulator [Rhizocola hellebori]
MHIFRVLGPLHVVDARITASRQQIVLAVLLLEANHVVPVGRLVDAVWEDAPPATAKSQIQICISTIRRALSHAGLGDRIDTSPAGYQIRVADGELDLRTFNDLVSEGRTAVREHRLEAAASAFRRALALHPGSPLVGLDSRVVRAAAARLAERRLTAAEEYLEVELRLGRHRELIDELMALVTEHPLRERLWHQLMTALYRSGRQAEALAAYQSARQASVDDLGLEPSEPLRSLERAILTGNAEPALMAELEPDPPDSEESLIPVPRMTPAAVPDFTGHRDLVDELCGFLRGRTKRPDSDSVPVAAITGRGGIGKTTLAVHLAHQLAVDFPDGQLFVHMGGHANGDKLAHILDRFLRALGISGSAVPDGLEARAATFRSRVAGARVLVVLDDAVDEREVRTLLPGSPSCGVIVTSRQRLAGIPGCRLVEVGVLDQRNAVELLARMVGEERVGTEPSEALQLVQLCGRLPLAMRIAAARLIARPHWKISQLTSRLADESRRLDELAHGGLDVRTSITFSYEALDDGAQRLLRRLGLLDAQDFQSWAAAPLLDADMTTATDTLDTLVDARLVDVVGGSGAATRYRLHDLVRVYARERLNADESAGERHGGMTRFLGAWLFLMECVHRTLYGGDYTVIHGAAPRWELPEYLVQELLQDPLMWFENERAAAVAAVGLASRAGVPDYCWDLAITMVALFESRSYLDDWRSTHELALLTAQQAGDSRGEAVMLYSLGALNIVEQRFSEASSRLMLALTMFEQIGEPLGRSLALRHLAFLDRVHGDLDTAWCRYEDALSVLQPLGDPAAEAHILTGMASIKLEQGDRDRAAEMLEQALHTATAANSARVHAMVLHRLGELHLEDGDLAQAEEELTKALKLVREGRDRPGEAHVLHGLGMLRLRQGLHQHAAGTLNHGYTVARRNGDRLATARFCLALARLHRAQRQYPSAMEWAAQAITLFDELQASSGRLVAHELLEQIRQEAT